MKLKRAEFLRKLEEIGYSRAEFAERCGFSRQAVTAWIAGDRNPKPGNVKKMAEVLRCQITEIAAPQTIAENDCVTMFSMRYTKPEPVKEPASVQPKEDMDLESAVGDFIFNELLRQTHIHSQAEIGRRTGLSASQINRIIHRKADLSLFPLASAMRLCPQIINRHAVYRRDSGPDDELSMIIDDIKNIADGIVDIHRAKILRSILHMAIEK